MLTEQYREAWEELYRSLCLIRRVEEEICRIYPTDKIKSPVHLSIGQEAVSVGVCHNLSREDIVFGTYRGHAMYLAKGGNLRRMVAELYGKSGGCAKGKGGSMHLIDVENGVMGTSAIVSTTIPLSIGYAHAIKYRKRDSIVVSFFGDGAVDEGVFYESINFAALKKLPILFICENNSYAIHSHLLARQPHENILERVEAFGIPAIKVENGNLFSIIRSSGHFAERIRNGAGPAFIECVTSRWKEHVGVNDDFDLGYRKEEEIAQWVRNDQVKVLQGLLTPEEIERVEKVVGAEIEDAFDFAEKSPFPGADELYEGLFKS